MKYLGLFISLILSTQAFAAGFECISNDGKPAKIIARDAVPTNITVIFRGRTVYSAVPVVDNYSNGVKSYQSPTFSNSNNAVSSLYVKIYEENGKLVGEFSEVSYLPIVPNFSFECHQID